MVLKNENIEYTPQILGNGYVLFAAAATECPICKKLMVKRIEPHYFEGLFFPSWYKMNQDAQMKRAGLVYLGSVKVDGEDICIECEKAGKAYFECELCGERKSTDKIQKSIGDPADFLCSDCYEITPAKIWNERIDQLEKAHRYDFE